MGQTYPCCKDKDIFEFYGHLVYIAGHGNFEFCSHYLILVSLCIGTYRLVSLLCMFPKHVLGMSLDLLIWVCPYKSYVILVLYIFSGMVLFSKKKRKKSHLMVLLA